MSGTQTFNYFTGFRPDGVLQNANGSSVNTVTDANAPLTVGEAGPDIAGFNSYFAGVVDNGLAFDVPTPGGTYTYILHDSYIAQYSNGTVTEISDVTVFAVDYNFDSMFCFLAGTGIATPDGEVMVEALKIGDTIATADGRSVKVKWVGIQTVANTVMTELKSAPVVVTAGALGNGLPHTDLYVSADHGLIIDGLVINAGALVNHTTIRHVPMAEMPKTFTYYHVETEEHDAILANGAAAETFIDYAARKFFDNAQEYIDLYGAERIIPEMSQPRISTRRLVPEEIKARLDGTPEWNDVLDDPKMVVSISRGAA